MSKTRILSLAVVVLIAVIVGVAWAAGQDVFQELVAYKLRATNSVATPAITSEQLEVYSNSVALNVAGGSGQSGLTSGVGIGVGSYIQQGTEWQGAIKMAGSTGIQMFGPLALANNSGREPASVETCTGVGSGNCDVMTYSSDSDGQLWITAGLGSQSAGTETIVFSQNWPSTAICTLTLVDLQAAWDPRATAKIVGNSQNSLTVAWNNRVPLPNGGGGPGNGINYHCLVLP